MDIQNLDWLTGGPCYNKYTFRKLHRKLFEGFIINARTNTYNIMCYIDVHERDHQSSSCDDISSGGVCLLQTTATTEALYLICATLYFIDFWLIVL